MMELLSGEISSSFSLLLVYFIKTQRFHCSNHGRNFHFNSRGAWCSTWQVRLWRYKSQLRNFIMFCQETKTVLYLHDLHHQHTVHHHGVLRVQHDPSGVPGRQKKKTLRVLTDCWWRRYQSHIGGRSRLLPPAGPGWEGCLVLEDDHPDLHQHHLHHLQHPRLPLLHAQRLHFQSVWLKTKHITLFTSNFPLKNINERSFKTTKIMVKVFV